MSRTIIQRLEAKTIPEPNSGCWLWLGAIDKDGYGQIFYEGQAAGAHRVAYLERVGPISTGLEVDHKCRTRCCVNPAHLEVVTHRVNTLRGETVPAAHSRKTHCPAGHDYATSAAVYEGRRYCRSCRARVQRRKGAA